jgi:excisionase family DNA binding protein
MILRDLQALFPLRTALRPREVCDTLGIGLTLFYALAKQGKLKVRKIGRVSVVSLADLAEYLDQPLASGYEREAC